jgi:hypothetical protein
MIGRLAAVALLALTLAPWDSAAAAKRACAKPHGYTVEAKTRYAVVYSGPTGDDPVYGCLFSRGRLVELYDAVYNYRLAGRYVAYEQISYEPEGTVYYLLTVRDLRRGTWHTISPSYVHVDGGNQDGEDLGYVSDVVLRKNGSVAWISCYPVYPSDYDCRDQGAPTEVWRRDSRGRKRLDASTEVGLRSLKRRGATITWRHGREMRSAALR